ncbi:LysR substrate-binding domain-containing protein [Variovorax guangxiensis]|uniref:LysR family transcriptional regulator n=1 Tax=Variovorax guangxiensis TaxID=1775474 RepID=A0A502E200_9BURK|nr:LysR substrate-binding domain-containing protein [Variovorax guangxiensis]TPG27024.1 LysR family transcriptional regulator [Variovorax ginsengisoli]TPG30752.1 LysR family transcriptional regulator [Variovorax guangxiensis]
MDFVQALEDFQAVSAFRSFSLAAKARAVTQPALSRRIQRLEAWVGAELIDRRGKPIVLTGAGQLFHDHVTPLLSSLNLACQLVRGDTGDGDVLSIQAAHSLCLGMLPRWLQEMRKQLPALRVKVVPAHMDASMQELGTGASDLVACHGHDALPWIPHRDKFDCFLLGTDRLVPVALADEAGNPIFKLDDSRMVSYLAYTEDTFLARAVSFLMLSSPRRLDLIRIAESSMAEVLKHMALQGFGLAWIPHSCVEDELRNGRLALAGGQEWQLPLHVHLYRRGAATSSCSVLDAFWALLESGPRLNGDAPRAVPPTLHH